MRVSLIAEQLFQSAPGGIGTYVEALLRYVPENGVEMEPVVAWHARAELCEAGVSQARRLRMARPALYRRWARSGRPTVGGEVVHATSLAFPWKESRPLIVTVHDLLFRDHPEAYPKRGVEFHERSLEHVGAATVVICPSNTTAQAVRALDSPPADVRVIPMGTDLRRPPRALVDRTLAKVDVQRPYVLWLGTMEPRKNPEGVVRGFVHAAASHPELNLYLVGPPGWWRGDIAELIESSGMTGRVRRLPRQPRSVKAALYAGAEAFVFPSIAEGFGLPVIEAMACGAPVVTSNRSSLPEVAGSAALLADPEDAASIGESLAKVLRDRDLAGDLRRLGFERAAEFPWSRTARETAGVYREVAG